MTSGPETKIVPVKCVRLMHNVGESIAFSEALIEFSPECQTDNPATLHTPVRIMCPNYYANTRSCKAIPNQDHDNRCMYSHWEKL